MFFAKSLQPNTYCKVRLLKLRKNWYNYDMNRKCGQLQAKVWWTHQLSSVELDWVCMFVDKLNNNINYMVKVYNPKTIFEA
jgi:hypothetical protein